MSLGSSCITLNSAGLMCSPCAGNRGFGNFPSGCLCMSYRFVGTARNTRCTIGDVGRREMSSCSHSRLTPGVMILSGGVNNTCLPNSAVGVSGVMK